MTDLTRLTIAEAREKLSAKEIKAVELTDAYLSAIEAANPAINAYVAVTPEKAREMAKASDARIAEGKAGALEGIPLGIKDLFATEGVHTQACSHILDGFKPQYESTVTQNLWNDGAVMLGKLNMDEFAMGSSNESSYYGAVKNPWRANGSNADLVPGGSSGGSAAAVAAFLCAGATATDTGGSIRQPAAFTGTVGIKPTYGRCSRWGIVAFASSLDQAGPIARDVRDAAILLKSMASVDAKDTTSVDRPVPDYEASLGQSLKGMRIGIPREYRVDGMPDEIEALWQQGIAWLKDAGAEIVDISLPHTKYALPAYYIVAPAEASSNLARYDGVRYGLRVDGKDIVDMYEKTRAAGFGTEVKRRIMIGTYVLSAGYYDAYYLQAQKVRTLIKRDFELAFNAGVDAILTPATPSSAFGIADEELASDPVKMYLQDIFTVTVNMAGLPGLTVPAGLDHKGLPLGLQLIGKPFDEESLFRTAHVIEQAAGRFTPAKWW
ncbi:aspartyl/glutamyl-tRNA amidotransferase subunit A [Shinella sumterensis]|jgi:aspartyl-tRNA(Asn)/glutamyl-tRNA(Gln) amidotransferase subunit A|uniref:Asp-tRNA(Asn)/Glu-tRNA(Gln) amidotransferase subunit GatA n=1 Tax=Shinella sumterensis TaxID=1967501 RepID=UPI00106E3034|nr:Asp-tRNA(Asn)/Glu-tRNA(Gln) amidotransferase subunit GatA [Shinella sumterensis]MCD1266208.1 Asp-tRNA(Asn)/Glu-tRNA(Gln) amidotransferase subunit GatA [Shinella sumterensis]TFE96817.1 aspartyl/glutamyl-tRNA amidotransferase subunit A [Shinella sumterensis]